MWESMTFENILNDMLSKVPSDVDKREGSIIFDALAPAAYKLAEAYFMLDAFLDLVSGDTAVGEYLDRVVADYGITRKPATYAIRKIETTGMIDITGTRWGLNDTTYEVIEKISDTEYKAQCEQLGSIGNRYNGQLENIDNISGVTAALTDIIVSGEDEETDENLRTRFFNQVRSSSTSGNIYDYKKWALEVPGCGDAKVFPLWNGPGTVKVLVVDENKQPATETLIQEIEEHIESLRPIGAKVTVVSAISKSINVSAKAILASGYSLQTVNKLFAEALTDYLRSIAFITTYVSYAKIGTILLGTDGVIDYSDLIINGTNTNIPLEDEEIPVLGRVDLEV